jgi:hypothetical protein
MGFASAPSHRYTSRASTPRSAKLPSVRRFHPPIHVPPSWFRTTMTACSVRESRVCCTPQPVKGSTRFLLRSPSAARKQLWRPLAFPATRFTPFEEFPSLAAVPHHCGRCPPTIAFRCSVSRLAEAIEVAVIVQPKPELIFHTWSTLRREQTPEPGEHRRPTSEETGRPCPPFGINRPVQTKRVGHFVGADTRLPEGNCTSSPVRRNTYSGGLGCHLR